MATLELQTGYAGYSNVLELVRRVGRPRAPREEKTLDAGVTTLRLFSPFSALPVNQGRRLNPAIAAAEAAQLVGAWTNPGLMVRISKNFARFRSAAGHFHGAYGRRVSTQVTQAVRKLRADRSTRQAVVTLWDPHLDNIPGEPDYPCTVGFNLAEVDGELTMNVIMRSSDVWLGLPYDLFQFTQLQLTVAHALNLPAGPFTLTTWSLHMYERDVEASHAVGKPTGPPLVEPTGFGRPGDDWLRCRDRAIMMNFMGAETWSTHFADMTASERWYRDTLAPFVG